MKTSEFLFFLFLLYVFFLLVFLIICVCRRFRELNGHEIYDDRGAALLCWSDYKDSGFMHIFLQILTMNILGIIGLLGLIEYYSDFQPWYFVGFLVFAMVVSYILVRILMILGQMIADFAFFIRHEFILSK